MQKEQFYNCSFQNETFLKGVPAWLNRITKQAFL